MIFFSLKICRTAFAMLLASVAAATAGACGWGWAAGSSLSMAICAAASGLLTGAAAATLCWLLRPCSALKAEYKLINSDLTLSKLSV